MTAWTSSRRSPRAPRRPQRRPLSGSAARASSGRRHATGSPRPIAASHSPVPLVKTWAGSVKRNAPTIEQLEHPPAETDPADDREQGVGLPPVDRRSAGHRPRMAARRAGASRRRPAAPGSRCPRARCPAAAGSPPSWASCHHGSTQPTSDHDAADRGQRPTPAQGPPVHGHASTASPCSTPAP